MKSTKISQIELTDIPKIADPRGHLAVVEKETIPFKVVRVYYLYDVPNDAYRGGHAHKEQQEFLIAVSGSFDVIVDDGTSKKRMRLDQPNQGLLLPTGIWRELENFSEGSVCLVLSSGEFLESDYIREYETFVREKASND